MTTTEVERILVSLIGDASSYMKMLEASKTSTKQAMGHINNSIQSVISNLSGFVSIADDFVKFDKAMTYSQSIMSLTSDQMKRMNNQAIELARSGSRSAEVYAQSYFYLASAGLNAEQQMASIPQIAKFATAGAFDMARATSLAADAQSALGLKSQETETHLRNLTRVTDVLVRANVLANANVEQFSIALTSKAGAALKSVNKDIEEGVAVLAAMADQGIKAELAGNTLARMLLLMRKSVIDNAEAHKILGFKVYDNDGKMKNLGDIVENLETSLSGMTDEAKAAALELLGFEARIQSAILPLLGTSKAIREYEKELRKASGYTELVAQKIKGSLSNQLATLANQFNVLKIELGQSFAPVIRTFNNLILSMVSIFNEASWLKTLTLDTIKYSLIAAALVPTIIALKNAFITLFFVMKAHPIGLIVAATIALTPAFISLMEKTGSLTKLTFDYNAELERTVILSKALGSAKSKKATEQLSALDPSLPKEQRKSQLDTYYRKYLADQAIAQSRLDGFKAKLEEATNEPLFKARNQLEEIAMFMSGGFLGKVANENANRAIRFAQGLVGGEDVINAEIKGLTEDLNAAKDNAKLFKDEMDKLDKQLEKPTISKAVIDLMNFEDQLKKEIATLGQSSDEIKRNQILRDLKLAGADSTKIKQVDDLLSKKKQVEEQQKATQSAKDFNKSLQEQIDTFGMTSREAEIYKMTISGVGAVELDAAKKRNKILLDMEKRKELVERGKSIQKEVMTPQEKQKEVMDELNNLYKDGFITIETYSRAMKKAGDEVKKTSQSTKELTGNAIGSNAAVRELMEYRNSITDKVKADGKPSKQQEFIKEMRDLNKPFNFTPGNVRPNINSTTNGQFADNTKTMADLMLVMVEVLNSIEANTSDSPIIGIA